MVAACHYIRRLLNVMVYGLGMQPINYTCVQQLSVCTISALMSVRP